MPCGLVRVPRSELDAWAAAAERGEEASRSLQTTVLDSSDGVRLRNDAGGYVPQVTKAKDGRLWFVTQNGASVFDPLHIPVNPLPQPVQAEQITAARRNYEQMGGSLRPPPLVRDLEIEYTALSLAVPEKVLFRYKLEGWDRDWQDAGTRGQAFYS